MLLDVAARNGWLDNQNIIIENNIIINVGSKPASGSYEKIIDGRDLLAIPGLINCHSHSSEIYLKGTTDCLPLETWLAYLFGTCGEFSPRDVYLASITGAIEMLKTGTTSVLDHLWLSPELSPDLLDAAMQAYSDIGIRATVAPLVDDIDQDVELAVRKGFPVDETFYGKRLKLQPSMSEQYAVLDVFFNKWHRSENGRLQCFSGPGGIHWGSEKHLKSYVALAEKYETMVHMHALETSAQAMVCNEIMGKSGIAILRDYGILNDRLSLAHSVWLTSEDIDMLAEHGTMVVHNPACNLKLGSGIAPIREMIDKGVVVGLGADGSASSDNQVMFAALKIAALKHNTTYNDHEKWISAREVMKMATEWGGQVMGHKDRLGYLKPGCLADITLLNLNTPYLSPLNDAYRALVFCETGASVDTVIVDGKIVVEKGKLLTVDEESLLREIREAVKSKENICESKLDEVRETMEMFDGFVRSINQER
jgi:cytosine/adenosine deaminase-related metal-dependent hydrolase